MARTSRSQTKSSLQVTMTHRPTGIEVTGDIPEGFYNRKEMKQLRQELEVRLFDELARKVARARRLPGNPARG